MTTLPVRAPSRGAPLKFLLAVLGGWCVARIVTGVPLFREIPTFVEPAESFASRESAVEPAAVRTTAHGVDDQPIRSVRDFARVEAYRGSQLTRRRYYLRSGSIQPSDPGQAVVKPPSTSLALFEYQDSFKPLSELNKTAGPMPVQSSPEPVSLSAHNAVEANGLIKRWSGDGWSIIRKGSASAMAATGLRPTYGASQAGIVLRYDLATGSLNRPRAYLRATSVLDARREQEVSLGLSARVIRKLPIAAQAEMRMTRNATGSSLRPAFFAVTELPPASLPFDLRAETYAAAGYVGGSFETPFAEGQARVTRAVAEFGSGSVRLGAGAWGGAQRGAERLDFGPTASIALPLGEGAMRLSVDYRFRVGGDAAPGSGPAVTLSTGF